MTITVDFWQVVSLQLTFLAFCAGVLKLQFAQSEKREVERFTALREALAEHISEERHTTSAVRELERQLLRLQADLPVQYVRREDHVRNQTIIEAKLDGINLRIDALNGKGNQNA